MSALTRPASGRQRCPRAVHDRLPAIPLLLAPLLLAGAAHAAEPAMSEGERLARVAGCVHCHTRPAAAADPSGVAAPGGTASGASTSGTSTSGTSTADRLPSAGMVQGEPAFPELTGGRLLATPFGSVVTPNLSPHPEQGLGRWRWADFVRAVREGRAPDGRRYLPAFPYTSYRQLSDADLRLIWDWLQSQPVRPSTPPPRPATLPGWLRAPALLAAWQALYLEAPLTGDTATDPLTARGAYLAQALLHCQECHSPRDLAGGLHARRLWQGAILPDGARAPSLATTADALGAWSADELADYLATGNNPYGPRARGPMREVITHMSRHLSADERQALAAWLLARPEPARRVRHGPR